MLFITVTLFVAFLSLYCLYVKKKFTYFEKNGVPSDPGTFPLGSKSTWDMFSGKVNYIRTTEEMANRFPNDKVVGFYGVGGTPSLLVNDLELFKRIMIKDFDHFTNRRPFAANPKANKLLVSMVSTLPGEKWRIVRPLVSSLFTATKLKKIMPVMQTVGDDLVSHLETLVKADDIDAKDLFQMYTIDVLAITSCGVQNNTFKNPNNLFYDMTLTLLGVKPKWYDMFKMILLFMMPSVAYTLNLELLDNASLKFIANIMRGSIQDRRKTKQKKDDFIDMLVQIIESVKRGTGEHEDEGSEKIGSNALEELKKLSDEEIETLVLAQGIVLFFAGSDTSSQGLSLISHHLGQNQDVQEKAYREIMDAIEENNGDPRLDYNGLQKLTFLDKVIRESLRSQNISFLERECTKEYYIPELKFTVPKGMVIVTPGAKIMKDQANFSNPNDFDPEANFPTETVIPNAFTSFGQGPRNCVGMRFAYIIMKVALVRTLANFKILPSSKTGDVFYIDPNSRNGMPKCGYHFRIEKRV